MLENEWNHALSDLPDEMIGEAANAYQAKRRRPIWVSVTSVAAAILIVVSMLFWPSNDGFVSLSSGIKVYAYEIQNSTELDKSTAYELDVGVEVAQRNFWGVLQNDVPGFPFTLSVDEAIFPGKKITFHIKADPHTSFVSEMGLKGGANTYPEQWRLGPEFTVENGTTLYWRNTYRENGEFDIDLEKDAFVADILIKADEKIVGYAVLALERPDPKYAQYKLRVIEKTVYPPVDGELQDVTKTYIEKKMEKAKGN